MTSTNCSNSKGNITPYVFLKTKSVSLKNFSNSLFFNFCKISKVKIEEIISYFSTISIITASR